MFVTSDEPIQIGVSGNQAFGMWALSLGNKNKFIGVEHRAGELSQTRVLDKLGAFTQFKLARISLKAKVPCQSNSIRVAISFFAQSVCEHACLLHDELAVQQVERL